MAGLLAAFLMGSCVDPADPAFDATVNVVVVDGAITDAGEQQPIRLNRSKADPLTGRFGTTPITGAQLAIVVDSSEVVPLTETDTAGSYRTPAQFRGQTGHHYQLRFTLRDGTRYESTVQTMQPAVPISRVYAKFNTNSLAQGDKLMGLYPAAHDIYLDAQDPADQHNYYSWTWTLWEQQDWCHSCSQSVYLIYNPNGMEPAFFEDCWAPVGGSYPLFVYDYGCRTQCWEILYSHEINVFADSYSNGGRVVGQRVAKIPFYQRTPSLVEIQQLSLTEDAYRYFKRLQDQTTNTGGLADTPPSAPVGNVRNVANRSEAVVGYFAASAVTTIRYWLDRKDVEGVPPGLFQTLTGRDPSPEPQYPVISPPPPNNKRPPQAVCAPSTTRTPVKPAGWQQ